MTENSIVVFTDGAAKGNPGPGGWGVVIITPDAHVTELGGGAPHTTNNRMELCGAIAALEHLAQREPHVTVHTDSSYVIKGITEWVWSWQRRGWKTATGGDVLNRDLWEQLAGLVEERGKGRIRWQWVKGHNGTAGNERVDQIAVAFSLAREEALYSGPLTGYGLQILPASTETRPHKPRSTSAPRPKGPAYSYLSVVDGVPERHATWTDCERRVKGRSGARFKKAMNAEDEQAILQAWGIGGRLF
jgi:ribonuclease HI